MVNELKLQTHLQYSLRFHHKKLKIKQIHSQNTIILRKVFYSFQSTHINFTFLQHFARIENKWYFEFNGEKYELNEQIYQHTDNYKYSIIPEHKELKMYSIDEVRYWYLSSFDVYYYSTDNYSQNLGFIKNPNFGFYIYKKPISGTKYINDFSGHVFENNITGTVPIYRFVKYATVLNTGEIFRYDEGDYNSPSEEKYIYSLENEKEQILQKQNSFSVGEYNYIEKYLEEGIIGYAYPLSQPQGLSAYTQNIPHLTQEVKNAVINNGNNLNVEATIDFIVFKEIINNPNDYSIVLKDININPQFDFPEPKIVVKKGIAKILNGGQINFTHEVFPNCPSSKIEILIENSGVKNLLISQLDISGSHASFFNIEKSISKINGLDYDKIIISFNNSSTSGNYNATFTINSNDPDEGTFIINLNGKAVIKPFIKKTLATGNYENTYSHYFADVNGDGKKDLIQISKLYAKGWVGLAQDDGTFKIWSHTFPTGENSGAYEIYFANVNGTDADGKIRTDIIQVSKAQAKGWIGLAQPDGNFQIWTHTFPTGEYNGIYKQYFPDINGDGRADLVQVQKKGVKGWIGLAQPNGNFKIWTSTFATGENNGTYTHRFADVNGDHCADLIQFSTGIAKGWIGESNCTNNFKIWTNNFTTGLNNSTYRMHFGDVNGDEKDDLVQFSIGAAKGWLGLANSLDNFDIWSKTISTGENNGTYTQLLANVNGVDSDGKIRKDLIQVDTTGKIWISISKGEGNLNIWDHTDQGQEGRYFAADINGDGKSDLISIGDNSSMTLISNPLYNWNN